MADSSITLYRLDGCPYCELVADVLDELDLSYDSRWTEPLHSRRDEVRRVSGQRAVPVLVDERAGVTMSESDNIVTYLRTTYGDADSPTEAAPDPAD